MVILCSSGCGSGSGAGDWYNQITDDMYTIGRNAVDAQLPFTLDVYGAYTPSSGPPDRVVFKDLAIMFALVPVQF